MPQELERLDFEGTVVRRDPDGFGLVKMFHMRDHANTLGVFTKEVLQNPAVAKACKVGSRVVGRAEVGIAGGVRVLRIEPKP